MLKVIRGIVEEDGRIRLLEPNNLSSSQDALVTATTDKDGSEVSFEEWRDSIKQAAVMWKGRDDIPELMRQIREEWDERLERIWNEARSDENNK